jgi:hypothetical protein
MNTLQNKDNAEWTQGLTYAMTFCLCFFWIHVVCQILLTTSLWAILIKCVNVNITVPDHHLSTSTIKKTLTEMQTWPNLVLICYPYDWKFLERVFLHSDKSYICQECGTI